MPPPYQPVGRCIYCGATRYSIDRNKLAEEHIVPFCLDGQETLPQASCKKCEGKTGGTEQHLFGEHGIFRGARVAAGSDSRSKKPRTVQILIGEPQNPAKVNLPSGSAPLFMIHFVLQRCAVLDGGGRTEMLGNPILGLEPLNRAANHPPHDFGLPRFNIIALLRLIAKVGHSYAVAELGIDGFTPLQTAFILDKGPLEIGLFGVGAFGNADESYTLALGRQVVGDTEYVYVDVSLLNAVGFPPYRVVVGIIPSKADEPPEAE